MLPKLLFKIFKVILLCSKFFNLIKTVCSYMISFYKTWSLDTAWKTKSNWYSPQEQREISRWGAIEFVLRYILFYHQKHWASEKETSKLSKSRCLILDTVWLFFSLHQHWFRHVISPRSSQPTQQASSTSKSTMAA